MKIQPLLLPSLLLFPALLGCSSVTERTLGSGVLADDEGQGFSPLPFSFPSLRMQQLYGGPETDTVIRSLRLRSDGNLPFELPTSGQEVEVEIYMAQADRDSFGGSFNRNAVTRPKQVRAASPLTLDNWGRGEGSWIEIPLQREFTARAGEEFLIDLRVRYDGEAFPRLADYHATGATVTAIPPCPDDGPGCHPMIATVHGTPSGGVRVMSVASPMAANGFAVVGMRAAGGDAPCPPCKPLPFDTRAIVEGFGSGPFFAINRPLDFPDPVNPGSPLWLQLQGRTDNDGTIHSTAVVLEVGDAAEPTVWTAFSLNADAGEAEVIQPGGLNFEFDQTFARIRTARVE